MNYNKKVLILGLGYVGLTLGLVFIKMELKFWFRYRQKTIKLLKSKTTYFL